MSVVELKLTGLTERQVRIVAAKLSALRDTIAPYNNGFSIAPHWAPIVHAEGPRFFTVYTPALQSTVAVAVLDDLADSAHYPS